jgi:hypothetical protein
MMNFHLSPISYKNYSLAIIAPLFAIALAIWVMEAYFGMLYGDLTRIGQLDEGDFGWRMQQPYVAAELLKSFPVAEADILVIGDSFSNGLIWQSRLISAGFKPSTLSWDEFKPCSLVQNLGEVVRQAGFRGRYVVIENVEHGFQNRMNSSCDITSRIIGAAYNGSAPETKPPNDRSLISLNRDPLGGDWVINAFINKIRLTYLFDANKSYMDFGDGRTRVVPIDGCAWFSNKLCNFGLFYGHDFDKKTFNSIGNILAVNTDLQKVGIEAIWLAIPDKATVYLGYGKLVMNPYVNIWDEFAQHSELVAPNLAESFKQESRQIKDFYKPNDVHLSTKGYLYLGDIMVELINGRKKNNAQNILRFNPVKYPAE